MRHRCACGAFNDFIFGMFFRFLLCGVAVLWLWVVSTLEPSDRPKTLLTAMSRVGCVGIFGATMIDLVCFSEIAPARLIEAWIGHRSHYNLDQVYRFHAVLRVGRIPNTPAA